MTIKSILNLLWILDVEKHYSVRVMRIVLVFVSREKFR